jgi:hypothetical protein
MTTSPTFSYPWQLVVGEFGRPGDDHGLADFDRVILDMLAPWDCVDDSGGCDVTGMSTQARRPAPHAASGGRARSGTSRPSPTKCS